MYAHTETTPPLSHVVLQVKGTQNWGRYQCQLPLLVSLTLHSLPFEDIHDLVKKSDKAKNKKHGFYTKYIVRTHISSVSGIAHHGLQMGFSTELGRDINVSYLLIPLTLHNS
jgi:hypothetical protein